MYVCARMSVNDCSFVSTCMCEFGCACVCGERYMLHMCACICMCVFEQGGVSSLLATPFAVAVPL